MTMAIVSALTICQRLFDAVPEQRQGNVHDDDCVVVVVVARRTKKGYVEFFVRLSRYSTSCGRCCSRRCCDTSGCCCLTCASRSRCGCSCCCRCSGCGTHSTKPCCSHCNSVKITNFKLIMISEKCQWIQIQTRWIQDIVGQWYESSCCTSSTDKGQCKYLKTDRPSKIILIISMKWWYIRLVMRKSYEKDYFLRDGICSLCCSMILCF